MGQPFYSACKPEDHMRLLDALGLKMGSTPMVVIPCEGSRQCSNLEEAEGAKIICNWLMKKGFKNKEIGVICFYADQVGQLCNFSRETGIFVGTVQNFSGSEYEVTIILTTKRLVTTNLLLSEKERLYTALTRCRQGGFIFMDTESLLESKAIEHFKGIYTELKQRGMVYPISAFSPENQQRTSQGASGLQ